VLHIHNNGDQSAGWLYKIYLNGEKQQKNDEEHHKFVDIGNCTRTCSEGSSHVRTAITTISEYDNPEITSREIVDEGSKEILLQDGNYTLQAKTYVEDACVPTEGCLSFAILSSFQGRVRIPYYTLYRDGKVIYRAGGDWVDSFEGSVHDKKTMFGNNC
jgi:hypothetical protein